MSHNRKLVGILFADIQGFTAFMQEDEEKGMAILSKYQEVLDQETKKYGGEIIKNYGDGSICIFQSAADTAKCAINIQKRFNHGKDVPLRIGLHLGDVIFKEGDIYGDALNIASRIESMAVPGAVLLSGSLQQKVINQPQLSFTFLGSYHLKNVKENTKVYAISNQDLPVPSIKTPGKWPFIKQTGKKPVLILLLIVLFFAGFLFWQTLNNPETIDRTDASAYNNVLDRSIAVLPFETIGAEEANNFTNGIHVDIITQLSKLSDIKIISRRSVIHYRDTEMRLQEIANELGVKWLLTGEVQQVGNNVRLNASLVNALENHQQWSESYLRELNLENYFAIQNEITEQIAEELKTQLLNEQESNTYADLQGDLETYRLYVEGRALLKDRSRESMTTSVTYFKSVLEKDSTYALAWVGLAEAWTSLQAYGFYKRDSLLPLAWEAIQRAIEIDSEMPEALAVKGLVHSDRYEGMKAVEALKKAAELRPTDSEIYNKLSWVQPFLGKPEEALANARHSVSLNPLSHEAVSNLSLCHMFNGNYSRGLEEANTVLKIEPDFQTGRFLKALALYHLERYEEAEELLTGLHIPWTGDGAEGVLALTHLKLGNLTETKAILDDLNYSEDYFNSGLVLAGLGETGSAFDELNHVKEWDFWPTQAIRYFFDDDLLDIRSQPGFSDIIHQVDLQWNAN